MQESSLHSALKHLYCQPGSYMEHPLEGFVIDIFTENVCLEIQTGNFRALKPKLVNLLPNYAIKIISPISKEKWIEKKYPVHISVNPSKRRRSPKKGTIHEISKELIYLIPFLHHPNLSFEFVFISEIEVQYADGLGSWRRKGMSILDHKLEKVFFSVVFTQVADYMVLLPSSLPATFTTKDLSLAAHISRSLAGKTCYLLKKIGLIEPIGKADHFYLYKKLH